MKFYLACFVLLAAFSPAKAQNGTTSINSIKSAVPLVTTSFNPGTPSPTHSILFSSFIPSNSSAINPNMTVAPNMTTHHNMSSTVHPNITIDPNMSTLASQNASAHVPSNTTVVPSSPVHSMSPSPAGPTSHSKDDKDYDSLKKRMWIAGAFAILFAITTVILAYLVYRQRRINRDLEGDPATSRLL